MDSHENWYKDSMRRGIEQATKGDREEEPRQGEWERRRAGEES